MNDASIIQDAYAEQIRQAFAVMCDKLSARDAGAIAGFERQVAIARSACSAALLIISKGADSHEQGRTEGQ